MRKGFIDRPPVARAITWLSTPEALGVLFLVGLLIRLWRAPKGGMLDDLNTFQSWVSRLVERGPAGFYPRGSERFFVDYPPGYLYVLWLLGLAGKAIYGPVSLPLAWLKLAGILGDMLLAWFVALAAERIARPDETQIVPSRFIGAAAILLNPAFIFLSGVWGQIDSVLGALLVGSFLLIGTGRATWQRDAGGMAVLAVAVATKPQALFVVPAVLTVFVWRYLYRPAVDAPAGRRKASIRSGLVSLVGLGIVAVITDVVIFAPFGLAPVAAFRFYADAASSYPFTGVFAFNLWGFEHFWRPGVLFWQPDSGPDALRVLGVPALYVGTFAFCVLSAYVAYKMWSSLARDGDLGRTLFFGGVALSLIAFAVLTRVHDRYLFAPLALGAVFVTSRRPRLILAVGSVAYLLMLWFAYVHWLEYDGIAAPRLGALYELLFGERPDGLRMRVYALVCGSTTLGVALLGWRVAKGRVRPVEPSPPEVVVA